MSFARPEFRFQARSFHKGYLDTPVADSLPPEATPDAKNAWLVSIEGQDQQRAVVRRRPGHRLITPAQIAAAKVDGLFEFTREAAAGELLTLCNGALRVFDNVDATTAITGGTGFTAGNTPSTVQHRNNLIVVDGTLARRYNGTAAFPLGQIKPTTAPTLAAVAPAGAGLTGTFEGFAVWYDSVMDHETSPSETSAAVALTAQDRQWTKPSGSPAANYAHWRVYCRRTDTNEANFFRIPLNIPVGTTTQQEATSDAGRGLNIGPLPDSNDPPTAAFAIINEWQGHGLGVLPSSSDLYVSKPNHLQSWHPKDVFSVSKGDGQSIRAVKRYGSTVIVQKPHRTWQLEGDRLPFKITPLRDSYGSVAPNAGVEADGHLYDWDERRGPYRTDLATWEPLADNRIRTAADTANRLYLDRIRCVHVEAFTLVIWAIPTTSTGRKRTLLAFNYRLNRWLPPITGLEYVSLATFTTTAGVLGVYVGDEWGRLFKLFDTETDGVPSGTTSATITAATAGSITASGAAFYTTGDDLVGIPVAVKSPTGTYQWVRVQSNTATVLTLDTTNGAALSPIPDPVGGTWTVIVGAINWYWRIPKWDAGEFEIEKLAHWLTIQAVSTSAAHELDVRIYLDQRSTPSKLFTLTFPLAVEGLVWGVGQWGVGKWSVGSSGKLTRKHRVQRSFYDVQVQVSNVMPDQPFEVHGIAIGADALPRRRGSSG